MLKNSVKSQNPNLKNQRKKEQKPHKSNSITTMKNIQISQKLSKNINNIKNKQVKSNEKKSLNISAKVIKNSSKEKDNLINKEISHRKKRIHKQASFISNENLQSTIDNEYKKTRDKKLGRHLSMRSSDIKKKNSKEKKINIENYLKELKSNKLKNKTKSNQISTINNNNNKIKLNNNLSTFSPIENTKNKKVFKISSKSKSKSKSKNKNKIFTQPNPNNNCININTKIEINTNQINNKQESNKELNLSKNESEKNNLKRNQNISKEKGALKPFCSMINIPLNNKIKDGNSKNKYNNSSYVTSNENNSNYIFDKEKYFKDFKNRMESNQRKKWKNIIQNKINKHNYLSEENIRNKNDINNSNNNENNNNKSKNNKKKKIKSISIINNATKKKEEIFQDDFIFNDNYIQKRKSKKKLSSLDSYNNYINSTNSCNNNNNNKNTKKNSKVNYNTYFNKRNSNNNPKRNALNIFEPQTTMCKKNSIYKNKFSNSNSNSNFNICTQTTQDKKSLTIVNENKHRHMIKSGRNKKSNRAFKTQNSNNKKNNYLKIVSLFDKLKKYKNGKKIKNNHLEICFLNNSNIRTNETNTNTNYYIDNTINNIDENKIKENLLNNTLTMYTLYILSKYYTNCDKIGLTKILLFDNKGNNIPIVCYNINSSLNNKQKIGISSLFNYSKINNENISNNFSLYECNNKDIPLILDYKSNLYINFYIKKIHSENIDHIQINNYINIAKKISPIKHIEIYKGNNLIYNGVLNELNTVNKIYLNNNTNNNKVHNSIFIKQRPLSSSKPRSNIETQNTKTSTYRKSEVDEYYRKRNIFKKSSKKSFILLENKYNNKLRLDYYKKQNEFIYNGLSKKCSANDIRNTKLLTGNLKQEINISNTYTINNMTNNAYDIQKTYYEFGELFTNNTNSEISNNINNKINKRKIFYISSQNFNYDINTTDESNLNERKKDIINAYDTNYKIKKNFEEKIFIRSNSEKKFKKPLIKTQKKILFQKILEENNKDNNNNNYYTNYNSNNASFKEKSAKKNFIEFNKIRFELISNYGHDKYIGLTGIEFYNIKNELINIETASSVGALPKDLKTIFNDNDEVRIFENVFNNYNNTNDVENMWVTKFNKKQPYTFIEIYFEEKIKISKIKIFNYNQKEKLEIGAKNINIYLDDKFYKKIKIRQGIGDYAYDYFNNINKENDNNNSFEYKNIYDFGQIIKFPITNEEKNFDIKNKDEIKFASYKYEQSYETPFLPCGEIIKFQFMSNYYKNISLKDELDILKYNDIGLDKIEIFDNEGKNIELNYKNNNFKIIANCEILHNDENKLILNGTHNENNNNCLFYVFDKSVQISYIKFYPLLKIEKNKKINSLNSLQEIKIFCDNNIIFEGNLYLYHPTIILFTSDTKIIKDINEKYLTNNIKNRECKEIYKENYISLVFN